MLKFYYIILIYNTYITVNVKFKHLNLSGINIFSSFTLFTLDVVVTSTCNKILSLYHI